MTELSELYVMGRRELLIEAAKVSRKLIRELEAYGDRELIELIASMPR